ncbi:orotidine-5'-phosphate decarboxylase [Halobacillus seohaensis]|uniref:Orotidine 5'-phosphate decarboxylase n=1 Tax=Halobacillus seohaensis TaxID=447421 RepID=A0ABW2EK62_9BACI
MNPLYVALDFENKQQTLKFLEMNDLAKVPVKVGMELFYKEGPSIIKELKQSEHPVFLDLKLHDIPATVKRAMKNLASLEVDVVNVHTQGGSRMIESAIEGLTEGSQGDRPLLLAVTQLTSTDETMLKKELLTNHSMEEVVAHYAQLSKNSGADGVVCSVKEVKQIEKNCGSDFLKLTPGIRQADDDLHDQVRVATPYEAGLTGSQSIVVGRSITQAKDPRRTYDQIKEEFLHGKKQYRGSVT